MHPLVFALLKRLEAFFSSGGADTRTPAQLEAEKWILRIRGTGVYRRWLMVPAVLMVQSCVGSLYSWSIFNKATDTNVWKQPGANALAFMLAIGFYGLGTITLGWCANLPVMCRLFVLKRADASFFLSSVWIAAVAHWQLD
jgi:hypothetical protein